MELCNLPTQPSTPSTQPLHESTPLHNHYLHNHLLNHSIGKLPTQPYTPHTKPTSCINPLHAVRFRPLVSSNISFKEFNLLDSIQFKEAIQFWADKSNGSTCIDRQFRHSNSLNSTGSTCNFNKFS